jgi:general secretion pathway protein F
MPLFQYTGTDPLGKSVRGTVESDSAKSARQKLKRTGVILQTIDEKKIGAGKSEMMEKVLWRKKVPVTELALLTRQLSSLIKANIPLVEALTAVMEQTEHDTLKSVMADIRQRVNEGSSFSKALNVHSQVFSNLFINMIDAGEASGTLPLVLVRLADFLESQMRLRSKVTTAMVYPMLMIVVGGTLLLGIFTFVIPRIGRIFESMNRELPWYTQLILNISNFLTSYWWLVIGAGLLASFMLRTYVSTKAGRERKDRFVLKLPIIGDTVRMIAVSRFANTMATLLNGGVPIITALGIAKAIVDNTVLSYAIEDAQENIKEGQSIAGPLKRSGAFPPLIIHMISIGERTGELPQMLEMVSSTYEEQVSIKIDRFTSLLEPIMIVVMGLAVGIIVMAVFTPLLQLQQLT